MNQPIGLAMLLTGLWSIAGLPSDAAMLTIDFEELTLDSADHYNGSDMAGGFTSQHVEFNNQYAEFSSECCWNGWAYSRATDVQTPGVGNQYSAVTGSGAEGSAQYAIAFSGFDAGGGIVPEIRLPPTVEPASVLVTNTTYAALSMLLGDPFAKKFGGPSGHDPDWFLLRVVGLDEQESLVGEVSFYLADYRSADPAEDLVVGQWVELDLTSLAGKGVRTLSWRLTSSDNSSFGMNTPAYVAIDQLVLDHVGESGDFDLNGQVDGLDLAIWQQHAGLGRGASIAQGDANDDGAVDGIDLLQWQQTFVLPSNPLAIVPEPATHQLVCAACLVATTTAGAMRRLARWLPLTSTDQQESCS